MPVSAVTVFAVALLAFVMTSARLERMHLTAPMVFTAIGIVLGLSLADAPDAAIVRGLAEMTLALILFHDAAEVRPHDLRGEAGLCALLLLVALPLTIALGFFAALVLFGGMGGWFALMLAAALAPTDAGLGAATVLNPVVPVRIRRVMNVESGLNDGLATPIVLFAISAAGGGIHHHPVTSALLELLVGCGVGIVVGAGAGRGLRWASASGRIEHGMLPIGTLAVPLACYYGAQLVDGNGFVAAFVAGTAFAAAAGLTARSSGASLELTTELSTVLSCAVWTLFGVILVSRFADLLSWQAIGLALVSLTVVRMAPVALVLMATPLAWPTRWFIGWFGPRGLASVVFGLIAIESLDSSPDLTPVIGAITVTVLLSVVCHGLSADVGATRYGAWVSAARPPAELASAVEPVAARCRRSSPSQVRA